MPNTRSLLHGFTSKLNTLKISHCRFSQTSLDGNGRRKITSCLFQSGRLVVVEFSGIFVRIRLVSRQGHAFVFQLYRAIINSHHDARVSFAFSFLSSLSERLESRRPSVYPLIYNNRRWVSARPPSPSSFPTSDVR